MRTLLIISALLLTACNAGTSVGPTQCIPAESVPGSTIVESGCNNNMQPTESIPKGRMPKPVK